MMINSLSNCDGLIVARSTPKQQTCTQLSYKRNSNSSIQHYLFIVTRRTVVFVLGQRDAATVDMLI